MTVYTDGTIEVSVPILVNGTAITTLYSAGDIMNNPAVGYGLCRFTMVASDGTTIATSNGAAVQDIYCYRHPTLSNTGIAKLPYGTPTEDTYKIIPFYGVRKADNSLDWRELSGVEIIVYKKAYPITVTV